ncbi:DxFTY motif-containing membrane protein [Spiroplasma diminutum]|uniref:Transmembrane protein n=1 Tax=Spiroplasma diminutum CUAS-1 TaxID=1276221 RepID=S5LZM5_9MOLU|nr:hypothetical protein [Spiroplasma diminutum]AGR42046.1 hypothetical protein SDIMI_v3c03420 [Spiroplasma diminutum CUAS-1]
MNNQLKNFNEIRTPFFKSLIFIMIESLIPGLLIWFTVGYDFEFSLISKLPNPNLGYVSLICTMFFLYTFLITLFMYKLKIHESDLFTYSCLITLVLITIILFGSFSKNTTLWIFIRFIGILATIIIFTPLFVFISVLFRNNEIKRNENYEITLAAFKKGEVIPSNKLIKAQRYQNYLLKKQIKQEELEKFKLELDEKIKRELVLQEKEQEQKRKNINSKLDKKEEKLRQKKQKD